MSNPDKIWWVYVVECRDGTLYTGISTDVATRVKHHNSTTRGAKYTRSRRPVKLAVQFPCGTHSAALKAEARFKKKTRKEKLRFIEEYCGACRLSPCDCRTLYGF